MIKTYYRCYMDIENTLKPFGFTDSLFDAEANAEQQLRHYNRIGLKVVIGSCTKYGVMITPITTIVYTGKSCEREDFNLNKK